MSVSLTNRDDMVVNSISLIQQSGLYDLGDNLIETVQSLPNRLTKQQLTRECKHTIKPK